MTSTAEVQKPTMTEIQDWIVTYLARLLQVEPEEVDITVPLDSYGLDWLGCEIDPTVIYDYPTVEALSEHLSSLA
jgi:acyl carrier protein